jgi:hypothetical protein
MGQPRPTRKIDVGIAATHSSTSPLTSKYSHMYNISSCDSCDSIVLNTPPPGPCCA